jgi:hypothetical protein
MAHRACRSSMAFFNGKLRMVSRLAGLVSHNLSCGSSIGALLTHLKSALIHHSNILQPLLLSTNGPTLPPPRAASTWTWWLNTSKRGGDYSLSRPRKWTSKVLNSHYRTFLRYFAANCFKCQKCWPWSASTILSALRYYPTAERNVLNLAVLSPRALLCYRFESSILPAVSASSRKYESLVGACISSTHFFHVLPQVSMRLEVYKLCEDMLVIYVIYAIPERRASS